MMETMKNFHVSSHGDFMILGENQRIPKVTENQFMQKRSKNYGTLSVNQRSRTPANRSKSSAITSIQKSQMQPNHVDTEASENIGGTMSNSNTFRTKRNTVVNVKSWGAVIQKSNG